MERETGQNGHYSEQRGHWRRGIIRRAVDNLHIDGQHVSSAQLDVSKEIERRRMVSKHSSRNPGSKTGTE